MKRSEMVKKIQDLVYMSSSLDLCLAKEEAETVLKGLEDTGMLPPKADLLMGGKNYTDHYWEPEEDELPRSGAV